MKNIVFIAPPGAGKGTQSNLLKEKYNMLHISTGDILREEVSRESTIGLSIKDMMAQGVMISTEIITELLKNKLTQSDLSNGFILDGYPRVLAQAEILDKMLSELNLSIDYVIYLSVEEEALTNRILGRMTCPKCNRGYNKFDECLSPKVEGICDTCNELLVSRVDDNIESLKVRYKEYMENTLPLIKYYEDKGLLKTIDGTKKSDEIFKCIESVIK